VTIAVRVVRILGLLSLLFSTAECLALQSGARPDQIAYEAGVDEDSTATGREVVRRAFRSRADSLEYERARRDAGRSTVFRVVISLFDRTVWVIDGDDTVHTAPAAVASGLTLDYADRSWTFRTPRGRHRVLRKAVDPVWTPPDWLYAEVALDYGLKLVALPRSRDVPLRSGSRLTVRGTRVGLIRPGSRVFEPLPVDEHIVFDSKLFIPPIGTENRRIEGELGRFALDLGDGYLIHGTPDERTIGRAITHGCIRLADEDIAWLYERVPIGTPVYIY
jgi:hypothetical protein